MAGMTWNFRVPMRPARVSAEIRDAASQATFEEASLILTRSQEEFVPIKTGHLKSSGFVRKTNDPLRYEIGYWADYAIPVHENLDAFHAIGQAKYLEQPFNEAQAGLSRRVSQRVRQLLGM